MPDQDQNTNLNAGRDVGVGGDVVGGDKNTTASAGRDVVGRDSITNTTINQRDPVALYAVLGLIAVTALLIFALAFVATRGATLPPTLPPTMLPATATHAPTQPPPPTTNPSPTATESPSTTPTPTATVFVAAATDTQTPTLAPTLPPTATPLSPTLIAPPPSTVPVFDTFSGFCLDQARWMLLDEQGRIATPTPRPGNCLDTLAQFFAVDENRLSVFLDREATQDTGEAHSLVPLTGNLCYKQAEVALALEDVRFDENEAHTSHLSVGLDYSHKTGDKHLEIRLEGSNNNPDRVFQYQVTVFRDSERLTSPKAYAPGTPLTVAFRVQGNALTAFVDNEPVAGPTTIRAFPCRLSLGYAVEAHTSLKGYFDEVRLALIAFNAPTRP